MRTIGAIVLVLLALAAAGVASAHPFGDRYLGHLVRLSVSDGAARLDYRLELPTNYVVREMAARERASDQPDPGGYVPEKLDELESGLVMLVDGVSVPMRRVPADEPTGLGNARFFIFDLTLEATLDPGPHTIVVTNGNHPETEAWHAGEVLVADDLVVDACNLFDLDPGQIRTENGVRWVLGDRGREVSVTVHPGGSGLAGALAWVAGGTGGMRPAAEAVEVDPMITLVQGELTPWLMFVALGASVFFGAAHALSPGHGKTLVAGYLVGTRGTIRHAILLGVVVTLSHTVSVFVLGLVTLQLTDTFAPESIFPWLELVSGLLVLGVGVALMRQRTRALRAPPAPSPVGRIDVGPAGPSEPLRRPAHAHDHGHTHDHGHAHGHDHGGGRWKHAVAHLFDLDHDHGVSQATDLRSLVSLGVSGGIVPCPTALVVLLTAVSLHRVAFGLVMVTAFSVGLGAVLIGIAIAVVLLGDRLDRLGSGTRLGRLLPVLSAVVVTALGLGILARSVEALLAA